MNTQIWLGRQRPVPKLFRSIRTGSSVSGKPEPGTGFWTSTWDGKGGDWFRWCVGENWGPWRRYPWWLLDVAPEAKVLEIATVKDMADFIDSYGAPKENFFWQMDWERIAREWDGIHLTDYGIYRRYDFTMTKRSSSVVSKAMTFYGWDCECTLWCRWVFQNIRPETPVAVPQEESQYEADSQ